jgi:hypothetical protein
MATKAVSVPVGVAGEQPAAFSLGQAPSEGQADPAVKFLARGRGFGLFLTQTETVLVLAPARGAGRGPRDEDPVAPSVVRMRLVGADAAAAIAGVDELPGRSHSLVGEPSRWRRNVPTFARVRYADVYPGVSIVFIGVKFVGVGDNPSNCLGSCRSCVPRMRTQIWQNPTEEIEEFIGMLFLNVCKLLGGSVSYELSAAFFEEPAKWVSQPVLPGPGHMS